MYRLDELNHPGILEGRLKPCSILRSGFLLKMVKRKYFGKTPCISNGRVGEVKMPTKSSKYLLPPFFEPDLSCSSPTIGSARSECRPFIPCEHWFFRGSGMSNLSPVQRLKEKNLTSRFPKNSACPYGDD